MQEEIQIHWETFRSVLSSCAQSPSPGLDLDRAVGGVQVLFVGRSRNEVRSYNECFLFGMQGLQIDCFHRPNVDFLLRNNAFPFPCPLSQALTVCRKTLQNSMHNVKYVARQPLEHHTSKKRLRLPSTQNTSQNQPQILQRPQP